MYDKMPKVKAYVMAHTHRDREWHRTFQQFRFSLVDMMARLLDLLEKDPGYEVFHLDGQTVMLEDYLEMRPEQRSRVKSLVEEGRLVIGPVKII